MKQISLNAINLDIETIKEIAEKTIQIKPEVLKILVGYYHYNFAYYNLYSKIDKAIVYYKGRFHKDLNLDERTILALYFIISNDEEFLEDLKKYRISNLCKKYCVSKQFILLRLQLLLKIKNYTKNIKKLEKDINI